MYSEKDAYYEKMFFHGEVPWRIFRQLPPALRGPFSIAPHFSYSIEFVVTDSIVGDAFIGGQHYSFAEKSVFYIPPGVVHAFNYAEGNGKILAMKLNLNSLSRYIDLGQIFPLGLLRADHADHDATRADILSLKTDIPLPDKLIALLRIFSRLKPVGDTAPDGSRPKPGLSQDELRTIVDWTEANLDRQITLADAAAVLGYNRTYFCAKFRETNHTTYLAYLTSARMTRACALIPKGLPIGAVARECGFQNESYFIKLFTKIIGFTPGRYREIASSDEQKSGE